MGLSESMEKTFSSRIEVFTSAENISDALVQHWRILEAKCIAPNAYFSVDYILPLIQHVEKSIDILIVAVWLKKNDSESLIGLGAFDARAQGPLSFLSKKLFPIAKALESDFIFQSGLLLHRDNSALAFTEITHALEDRGIATFLLSNCLALDYPQSASGAHHSNKIKKVVLGVQKRITLSPENAGPEYLAGKLSRNRKKEIRRKLKQLSAKGDFSWVLLRSNDITDKTIENFLRLEDCGWKGKGGTSLLADPCRRQFFEQAVKSLVERDLVFFTEISLNDEVIASTCNLVAQDVGFAFKLGWDQAYAKYSVGLINEYLLVENAPVELAPLRYFDSGAGLDSFLNQLWNEEINLYNYAFTSSKFMYCYYSALSGLRSLKNKFKKTAN